MIELEGIDHIAIEVEDLDRSEEWYGEILGLKRRYEETWGDIPLVMGIGTTSLAMFARSAEESPAERPGLRHIAFRVDRENFERAQVELSRRGIEFAFSDHEIAHSIYFPDPDGYRLEITTYEI